MGDDIEAAELLCLVAEERLEAETAALAEHFVRLKYRRPHDTAHAVLWNAHVQAMSRS